MRIVFMGTPDFADASLKRLIEEGFDVVAVFTNPDKPRGRGMAMSLSPVKETALVAGIPVFQPESLRDGEAAELLKRLEPELLAVVAYGHLLPEDIINLPRFGAVNIHASLLPQYRGAAPIQWTVLNGDRTAGVTSIYIEKRMDAGDVIYREETEVGEYETSGQLFDRLKLLGAGLLCRTIRDIGEGTAPRIPQDESMATFTTMLDKSMCPIDWSKTPREIIKWICGLIPWPVATAELAGELLKIYEAEYTQTKTGLPPGSVVSSGKAGIEISCGGGSTVMITRLQAAGGKRMSAGDYLLGHSIEVAK